MKRVGNGQMVCTVTGMIRHLTQDIMISSTTPGIGRMTEIGVLGIKATIKGGDRSDAGFGIQTVLKMTNNQKIIL